MKSLFILLLAFISCTPRIIQYSSPGAKYNTYKTYVLIPAHGSAIQHGKDTTSFSWKLEQTIHNHMALRSYQKDNNSPNLVLKYDIISNTESRNRNNLMPFGYYSMMTVQHFSQSILLLELIDDKTKKMVWQASVNVEDYYRRNTKKDPMERAVNQLFNTYLYKAGSNTPDPNLKIK